MENICESRKILILLSMNHQHWSKKWHGANLVPGHFLECNDDKNRCCLERTVDVYELNIPIYLQANKSMIMVDLPV